MSLTESIVEEADVECFDDLGNEIGRGPKITPGEPTAERAVFRDVVLAERFRKAVRKFHSALPQGRARVNSPQPTKLNDLEWVKS